MFFLVKAPILHDRARHACRLCFYAALTFGSAFSHAQSGKLSLDEAMRISLQRSSFTKAADASVQASRESAAKADQLPDPTLKVGIDNLPVTGSERYSTTSDFMTMRRIGIEQQWVSADKRAARSERAQRSIDMEQSAYFETVAKVREETAKAWIAVLYGQRTLAFAQAMEQAATDDLVAVRAAHRGAKATAADVTQGQIALAQAQDTVRKNAQELANARVMLGRWVGESAKAVVDDMPPLVSHVSTMSEDDLEKYHPMLLSARRAIDLADADTTVATRESRPDWAFEASYAQRGSQYSNMVSFGVSIPLAVNRGQRQDRDIAEKSALGTRARMQYEEVLRDMQTDIQTMSGTLTSLNERVAQLNAQALPPALQQVDLATAAYRAGSGNLSAIFSARKMLLERQLQIAELEKEAALTWAALEFHVIPHDATSAAKDAQ